MDQTSIPVVAKFNWDSAEELRPVAANQFMLQAVPSGDGSGVAEFVLNIGFSVPPVSIPSAGDGTTPTAIDIPIQTILRVVMSAERLAELGELLDRLRDGAHPLTFAPIPTPEH